jgi:NRAMP (natural resistance-associated macrophage protein)-like metal ion transporter
MTLQDHNGIATTAVSTGVPQRRGWLAKLGPGLITGAADDDPSGIATYSQGGARFGYGTLWTVLFTTPLMIAIQVVSARIGIVTGRGIAANMRNRFSRGMTLTLVGLLIGANTINIAADLAAMSQALRLLIDGQIHLYAIAFGLICFGLQLLVPYARYVRVLKWLTLSLLAYVAVIFTVEIPWRDVLYQAVMPALIPQPSYITTVVAIFGTTISPYLFFWQAAQEIEEQDADVARSPLRIAPEQAESELQRVKIDTTIGMCFSNLIAFFIMLTTAVTLHAHGIVDIETTEQAAQALRPIAGDLAFLLFSLGVIGTGLLAVPVLAGSAAYAGAEALNRPGGLDKKLLAAREFYAIIAIATLGGVLLTFAPIDAIKLLYWAAVINGVISVPIMAAMVVMASSKDVMHQFTIGRRLKSVAWLAVAVVTVAVLGMFYDVARNAFR